MGPSDLSEHAGLVDDGRAFAHAVRHALVDDDLARVRVGRVVQHLGGLGRRGEPLAQLQHLAQARVLQRQLLDLVGALRLLRELGACVGLDGLRAAERLEVLGALAHRQDRLQGDPLQRVERRGHRRTQRLGDAKAGVGHHQEQRQGTEHHQLRQRRRALLEEGGRRAVQRTEWHRCGKRWATRK
jgi:hypothetical protein